ncbi:MAG: hypothetical protein ACOY0T_16975 [Myxococcota bacterium]
MTTISQICPRRAAWSALLCVLALPACGNSNSSHDATGGAASGGRNTGGAPSTAKGGAGGVSAGGTGGKSSSGDFSSVWRFENVEVTYLDSTTPTMPKDATATFPSAIEVPADGREAEFLRQFEADQLVTYAYYAGESAYYRLTETALKTEDSYVVSSGNSGHVFTLEEGKLIDTSTSSFGSAFVISKTTYRKLEGAFPPSGWPSQFVTHAVTGGAQ